MAPGGEILRYHQHFGENVLLYGSHEWLPYSKDEVRLKTVNTNLSSPGTRECPGPGGNAWKFSKNPLTFVRNYPKIVLPTLFCPG